MGLSVGVILNQMDPPTRQEMYNCDVTYGINSEFGFDYLRDNMSISKEDQVQRSHYYSIVDEVDSVLIDEARTPLIISGTVDSPIAQRYTDLRPLVDGLMRKQNQLVNTIISDARKTSGRSRKRIRCRRINPESASWKSQTSSIAETLPGTGYPETETEGRERLSAR